MTTIFNLSLSEFVRTFVDSADDTAALRRDSCRTIERHGGSIEDLTGAQSAIIELTPAGHGVWSSYDSAPHNRRNCESLSLSTINHAQI